MCGELFAVLKTKLEEGPGMNTVLNPEISDKTRNGLMRRWSSVCEVSPEIFFGRTWLASRKNCKQRDDSSSGFDSINMGL
jgi:hypothetical protein